jgi:Rrf2 family protein
MNKQVYLIKSDTDYAMRMLLHMALTNESKPVPAGVMVEACNIPKDFAYKILQKLCRAGIVKSYKGANGGFTLAKDIDQISLYEVIEAVQGRIIIRPCLLNDDKCSAVKPCCVSIRLQKLQAALEKEMTDITLAGIISIRA